MTLLLFTQLLLNYRGFVFFLLMIVLRYQIAPQSIRFLTTLENI